VITFIRIIRYGFVGFFRNILLSSATVLILVVTLSAVTALLLLQVTTDGIVQELEEKVDVSVYFHIETPEEDILQIREELVQFPEVRDVQYVSREEALARFKERHRSNVVLQKSLEELGSNPLEASLNIRAQEATQYRAITNFLEARFGDVIDKVNYREKETAINRLFAITNGIERAGLALAGILFLVAILVAFNTIRLAIFSLRDEIGVMRLVGASNWFIRGPFVVQGMLAGFFASLITLGAFWGIAQSLSPHVGRFLGRVDLLGYYEANILDIFLLQLAIGAAVGIFSSLIAVSRYLKV